MKGSTTAVLILTGAVVPDDIPALCARVEALVEGGRARVVLCDVGGLDRPDATTVDVLARLALTAQRHRGRLELRRACGELRELLTMMGLADVLVPPPPSGPELQGQPEQREQALGVEEEGDPSNPPP